MKIAVASDGTKVAAHFGHCEGFWLCTAEGSTVTNRVFLKSPPHEPGALPRLLADQGATVVIAGGMGRGAVDLFDRAGIAVVSGVAGTVDAAVQSFLDGQLAGQGEPCDGHGVHAGNCGH